MLVFILVNLFLIGVSNADLNNYNEFLTFSTKNHYRSVSEYATNNGFKNFEQEFEKFRTEFSKKYTQEEEELRKFNFLKSLEYIESHNGLYKKGEVHHQLGLNHLADMTPDEYNLMQNTAPVNLNFTENESEVDLYDNLPASFDWRDRNKVTPIKNQGSCGSCWAFTCLATIEAHHAIKHNQFISLSEQQLVDCSSIGKYTNKGCSYGYINQAFQYVLDNGIEYGNDYPYQMRQASCQNSAQRSHLRIGGFQQLKYMASDLEIMNAIYTNGPVAVNIDANGNDFSLYRGGIISSGTNKFTHYVTAIGWGTQNNIPYWIIKNSWGPQWGEKGFGRMIRGRNIRNFNAFIFWPKAL